MKKGQVVKIYRDPITQLELEGKARLIKQYRPDVGDGLEMWDCRFSDAKGEPIVLRTIKISVDNKEWFDKFSTHINELKRLKIGGNYDYISDSIYIAITIPMFQENPKFDKRNENLSGKAVTIENNNDRLIRKEVNLFYPLDKKKLRIKLAK